MEAKILHFTHIDSDALGCDVIIKHSTSKEVVTYYINNNDVDRVITKVISKLTGEVGNSPVVYDNIFITDIGPSNDTLALIVKYKEAVESKTSFTCNLYGFDHHLTNNASDTYNWFIVADNLKTLYTKYHNRFIDKGKTFRDQYHMYVWEHDRADETNYRSIDDVDNDLSMKISATYLVGAFFTYNNNLVSYEWKSVTISDFGYRSIALFKLIEDISKYDTWEWKTNKFIRVTKHEDMPQVLIKIVGITKATALILDTIYHSTNFKERYSISYFPREYGMMYEYLKYKSFDYVKKSLMNVKLLDTQGIKELAGIIGCDLSDLNRVFISLSDNTIDVNEQATFMTEFLDNEFGEGTSVFMHIFVSSSTLSMRTCRDYDVSHIATALGGGGHKGAAGARVSTDTLLSLIRLYHESGIDLEIVIKKQIYTNYLSDYSKTLTPITTFDYSVKVER